MTLPTVHIFSLGGTIAMTGDGDGVKPSLNADDLIRAVPLLEDVADIQATSFRNVPSANLTISDLAELCAAIDRAIADGAAGIVITQGTDTMEECAFALDVMLRTDTPVIITGAMRNPTLPGADGPANLLAAVLGAASSALRGLGVLVIMNDEIHAARWVRKSHSMNVAAFGSPGIGRLGRIEEGRARVFSTSIPTPHISYKDLKRDARVALVTAALEEDGCILPELSALGYSGVVIAALGGGHVSEGFAVRAGALAKTMPVILSARIGTGGILQNTYGYPGSERDLIAKGLIPAGSYDAVKARLLLLLLLRCGHPKNDIQTYFRQ